MKLFLFTTAILKDFKRKKSWLTLMLLMPLLSAMMIGSVYEPAVDGAIPIAWVDEDQTEASLYITELVNQESLIRLIVTDREGALELTRRYQVEGAYIIPEGFEDLLQRDRMPQIEMIRSAASFGAETIAELITSSAIRMVSHHRAASIIMNEYRLAGVAFDESRFRREILLHADTYWESGPVIPLVLDEQLVDFIDQEPSSRGILAGPQGAIAAFITLFAVSLPLIIEQEKKAGRWQRIVIITGSEGLFRWGTVLAYTILQLVMTLLVTGIISVGFQVRFPLSPILLIFLFTVYAFFLASFFCWLAGWRKTAEYAGSLTFLTMFLCMVSGCFWTLDLYPARWRMLAALLPPGYFMNLLRLFTINDIPKGLAGTALLFAAGLLLNTKPFMTDLRTRSVSSEETM